MRFVGKETKRSFIVVRSYILTLRGFRRKWSSVGCLFRFRAIELRPIFGRGGEARQLQGAGEFSREPSFEG